MRIPTKALLTATLSAVLLLASSVCFAAPSAPRFFKISFEPQGELVKGAPVTMHLEYYMDKLRKYGHLVEDTGSYTVIFLNPRNRQDTLSQTTFAVRYDTTYSLSETFQVVLPDVDTSLCILKITCGPLSQKEWRYFVASGDKIEFYHSFVMPKKPSLRKNRDPIRDTLTQEHLQKKYDVILYLNKASARETAEKLLGTIPDSCLYDPHHQYYRMTITLEMLIKLADNKVGFEYATPPPWDSRYENEVDTIHKQPGKIDSTDLQGAIPEEVLRQSPPGISLDRGFLKSPTITFTLILPFTDSCG